MKKMSRIMALILVLAMMAGVLVGCAKEPAVTIQPEAEISADILLLNHEDKWNLIVEQAKKEGKVTFYAYSEEPFFKEIATQFKTEYGIDVEVIMGEQNAIFEKVGAEGNRAEGTVDAILMGGQNLGKMLNENLFYGPFAEMVPNYKYLDTVAAYFTEGIAIRGMLIPFRRNQTGFVYNPEKVSNPPQTVAELEQWIEDNPKRFGYVPPNQGGSGQSFVTALIYELTGGAAHYSGQFDQAKTDAWIKAWDFLNKIEPNIVYGNSNADILDKINQGEIWIGPNWEDMTYKYLEAGNLFKHAEIYIPEGIAMLGGSDALAVIKNAPNKAAALVWINFLISESAQKQMNEMIGAKPSRQNVDAKKNLITDAEISAKGATWFNGDYKSFMINTWIEEVGRK